MEFTYTAFQCCFDLVASAPAARVLLVGWNVWLRLGTGEFVRLRWISKSVEEGDTRITHVFQGAAKHSAHRVHVRGTQALLTIGDVPRAPVPELRFERLGIWERTWEFWTGRPCLRTRDMLRELCGE